MIDTLTETEGTPAAYPSAPSGLSSAAAAIEPAVVWRRIEDWIRHRWAERTVTWIVSGSGSWTPRLTPATVTTFEVWKNEAWQSVTLDPSPLGYLLDGETYRMTATVGSADTPPAAVLEAYRRLAEYLAQDDGSLKGATSVSHVYGEASLSVTRPATWYARAIHYSGAADALRPWRG